MSTDNDTATDLKGKEFDEVCELINGEKNVRGIAHKKSGATGPWAYCMEFKPLDYDEAGLLATLAAEFGPGEYPIQFKAAGPKNAPVIRWQKNFHVEARRISVQQREAATPKPDTDPIAAALESNNRLLATLVDKISQGPAPATPPSTIEILKEAAVLKELFTGNQRSPFESMKEMLEMFTMMQEFRGDADDGPLAVAMRQLIPAITKGAEQMQQVARPANAPAGGATPAPATSVPLNKKHADPAPAASEPELDLNQAFDFFAGNYLPAALHLAEARQEPQQVANYLQRLIGGDVRVINMIGDVISQDDMVERFAEHDPAVMKHAKWFDQVADWLAHALWPETNPAPEAENATKNATSGRFSDSQGINGAEIDASEAHESVASGGAIPDARNPDPSREGHDNDA